MNNKFNNKTKNKFKKNYFNANLSKKKKKGLKTKLKKILPFPSPEELNIEFNELQREIIADDIRRNLKENLPFDLFKKYVFNDSYNFLDNLDTSKFEKRLSQFFFKKKYKNKYFNFVFFLRFLNSNQLDSYLYKNTYAPFNENFKVYNLIKTNQIVHDTYYKYYIHKYLYLSNVKKDPKALIALNNFNRYKIVITPNTKTGGLFINDISINQDFNNKFKKFSNYTKLNNNIVKLYFKFLNKGNIKVVRNLDKWFQSTLWFRILPDLNKIRKLGAQNIKKIPVTNYSPFRVKGNRFKVKNLLKFKRIRTYKFKKKHQIKLRNLVKKNYPFLLPNQKSKAISKLVDRFDQFHIKKFLAFARKYDIFINKATQRLASVYFSKGYKNKYTAKSLNSDQIAVIKNSLKNLVYRNRFRMYGRHLKFNKNKFLPVKFLSFEKFSKLKLWDFKKSLMIIINETKNNIYITVMTFDNKIIFRQQKGLFYASQSIYTSNLYKKSKKFVYENIAKNLINFLGQKKLLNAIRVIKLKGRLNYNLKQIIYHLMFYNLKKLGYKKTPWKHEAFFYHRSYRAHNGCRKKKQRRL